jgi:hypothetical protein
MVNNAVFFKLLNDKIIFEQQLYSEEAVWQDRVLS